MNRENEAPSSISKQTDNNKTAILLQSLSPTMDSQIYACCHGGDRAKNSLIVTAPHKICNQFQKMTTIIIHSVTKPRLFIVLLLSSDISVHCICSRKRLSSLENNSSFMRGWPPSPNLVVLSLFHKFDDIMFGLTEVNTKWSWLNPRVCILRQTAFLSSKNICWKLTFLLRCHANVEFEFIYIFVL